MEGEVEVARDGGGVGAFGVEDELLEVRLHMPDHPPQLILPKRWLAKEQTLDAGGCERLARGDEVKSVAGLEGGWSFVAG